MNKLFKIPFLGLGLGKTGLTDSKVKSVTSLNPNLQVLYIESNPQLTDNALKHLYKLKSLKMLSVRQGKFSDTGLKHLSKIKSLEFLKIDNMPNITNQGIKEISNLPNLKGLCIGRDKLTKKGFSYLAQMKSLKILSAPETHMTDEDLEVITKMNLEKLDVSRNPITIDALTKLKQIPSLSILRTSLKKTEVAEIKALKEALPRCEILMGEENRYEKKDILLSTDTTFKTN